jgi:chemosensory pili system protein ChpA (sensor histidine kinase/response regulator)
VVIFRSAAQRVALHVDEVLGNQEVVVKNLGRSLRLPGLAGMSVLASGAVVLIYNPVALANVYGEQIRGRQTAAPAAPRAPARPGRARRGPGAAGAGGGRLHHRAPRHPAPAAARRLPRGAGCRWPAGAGASAGRAPTLVLSDIEMPRMDGFDLARNIRADPALGELPIIMITSRIAQAPRACAEMGVNHYLGKPYAEEELLSLVRHYAGQGVAAPMPAES